MATITYRALWRWHFHAGMFCIPFVIVLALTGSIYLFKPQIDAFADRDVDSLSVTGRRATGEAQIAAAIASQPGSKLFVYRSRASRTTRCACISIRLTAPAASCTCIRKRSRSSRPSRTPRASPRS